MPKDVISLRVKLEVKEAWDQLTDNDKMRIRDILEELVLLHASGFSVELLKRELDSLRADICPLLKKIVEYYNRSSCIEHCHDDLVKSYFYKLYYIVNYKLCTTYPVKPQSPAQSPAPAQSQEGVNQ